MLTSKIQNILIGTVPASKMMYKGMQLWPRPDTLDVDYLCFESDSVSSIQFCKEKVSSTLASTQYKPDLQYSYDCNVWNNFTYTVNDSNSLYDTQIVYFNINKPLYVRGFNPSGFVNSKELTLTNTPNFYVKLDGDSVYCKGKLSTLIDYSTKVTTVPHKYCFSEFFKDCTVLKSAPELDFTTLAEFCYYGMFRETSIEEAPELPAQVLSTGCYDSMFYGCENLRSCTELPAQVLANRCYKHMFAYTSISSCQSLPATSLAPNCYEGMFYSCSKLKTAPELPAVVIENSSYYDMFSYSSINNLPSIEHVSNIYPNGCARMFYACNGIKQSSSESFIIKANLSASACKRMFEYSSVNRVALQSKKLYDGCYAAMFFGSSVKVVSMLATEADENAWSTDSYNFRNPFVNKTFSLTTGDEIYLKWLDDVTPGHIILNNNRPADWNFSKLGIPTGWTSSTVTV
jgi:hypothetical protein